MLMHSSHIFSISRVKWRCLTILKANDTKKLIEGKVRKLVAYSEKMILIYEHVEAKQKDK